MEGRAAATRIGESDQETEIYILACRLVVSAIEWRREVDWIGRMKDQALVDIVMIP